MIKKENVIKKHKELVILFGGSFAIINKGNLDFAVADYNSYRTNPMTRSLKVYYNLLVGHSFSDGNKRVAIYFLNKTLKDNGYKISLSDEKLAEITNKLSSIPSLGFTHVSNKLRKFIIKY